MKLCNLSLLLGSEWLSRKLTRMCLLLCYRSARQVALDLSKTSLCKGESPYGFPPLTFLLPLTLSLNTPLSAPAVALAEAMNPLDTDPIAQVAAGGQLDSSSQLTEFDSLAPSFKEIIAGTDGSVRRTITYYVLGWLIATAVRVACFNPL